MVSKQEQALWNRITDEGVIAVIVVDEPKQAVDAVSALQDGGVNAIELALRTPAAFRAAELVRRSVPQLILGIGTVLMPTQVKRCREVGADFAVSPGLNRRVVIEAIEAMLPFAPGIATPSDIEAAVELGCQTLKFFPAEPSGGLAYLKGMAAPYQHLNLRYIPLGGIDEQNCQAYLQSPLTSAVGGSWLAPTELIRDQAWGQICTRAQRLRRLVDSCRGSG